MLQQRHDLKMTAEGPASRYEETAPLGSRLAELDVERLRHPVQFV